MLENELCFPRSASPERTKTMTVEFPSYVMEQHAFLSGKITKVNS